MPKKTEREREAKGSVGGICTSLPCIVAVFVLKEVLTYPVIRATANNPLICKSIFSWSSLSSEVDKLHV